jgi:hypothetical protein
VNSESLLAYLSKKFKPYYDGPNEGWSLEIIQLLEPLWSRFDDLTVWIDEACERYSYVLTEHLPVWSKDDFFDYVLFKEPVFLLLMALIKSDPFMLSSLFETKFDGRWVYSIANSMGTYYPDPNP